MIPPELIKQIRRIQIYTSRMVNASFAGQYESVFKGRGMQFDQVREYVPGDDIRSIDWNVTARTSRPYIKQFVEEREMTVIFAVDLSASGAFGTKGRMKNTLAAEFCAVMSFAAAKNNDKVGLLIFTDGIELYIPPKKGSGHILRLIRELLYFEPKSQRTDISEAVDYLARVTKKKATIFVVSDFLTEEIKKPLSRLNKRHDVIAVNVSDPAEKTMPVAGLVELVDAESGEMMTVDTASKAFRQAYLDSSRRRGEKLKETLRAVKIDSINVSTDKSYINDVVEFFRMRQRRF
ncbi:MAG: DUF58 domain-containing protein [Anaerohalosphaeraceae bacterium]|nr:DUF58 domain-containing protein [Anaerohalosphaeraceae bacterium]